MSRITHVVMHYSATYADQNVQPEEIRRWHLARGWRDIGYHYVITADGRRHAGRQPETAAGAHVAGRNSGTIGICVTGGLTRATGPDTGVDTRNREQIAAQIALTREILARHPGARVVGHRDLGATQCPAYDAAAWWASVTGGATAAPAAAPAAAASPPPGPGTPTVSYPLTRRGSRGAAVRSLQQALAAQGFRPGPVDGIFGPATEAAVRAFQAAAGIDVDGIVGPITWAALFARG